jgi:hypothetical protein
MAARYHQEIRQLITSLRDPDARGEASRILRSLVDMIVLTPQEGQKGLTVDLIGDLAGILSIATKEGRLAIENELSKLQPVNGSGGREAGTTVEEGISLAERERAWYRLTEDTMKDLDQQLEETIRSAFFPYIVL